MITGGTPGAWATVVNEYVGVVVGLKLTVVKLTVVEATVLDDPGGVLITVTTLVVTEEAGT